MHCEEPKSIKDRVTGEKTVTAADIITDADVEILNPDLHIATVDASGSFQMELTVERGRGYVPSHKTKVGISNCVISIDSIFSPIQRVNYIVTDTRVGNVTDYDKLTLELWTDGSMRPEEAISKAASVMIAHLKLFQNMAGIVSEDEELEDTFMEPAEDLTSNTLDMTIEDLKFCLFVLITV